MEATIEIKVSLNYAKKLKNAFSGSVRKQQCAYFIGFADSKFPQNIK